MSAGARSLDPEDTIVAVATGQRLGRRSIVRLSGPAVAPILARCFRPKSCSDAPGSLPNAAFRSTVNPGRDGKTEAAKDNHTLPSWLQLQSARRMTGRFLLTSALDTTATLPADLWLWPDQRSYTRQPSAEFHLPALPFLADAVVRQCIAWGARPAAPGEFTMRAFLAGRLDLIQAQAVLQLIQANDPTQLQSALGQLAGGLSVGLRQLREQLIAVLAHLEAGLDFVDEDIEFISGEQLQADLREAIDQVTQLLRQLKQRTQLGHWPRVLLIGPPNAGKSSLFNALTPAARAIVSPQRGTTRDYLSAVVNCGSQTIELIDTAGLDAVFDGLPALQESAADMNAALDDDGKVDGDIESGVGRGADRDVDSSVGSDVDSHVNSHAKGNVDVDMASQQLAWRLLSSADLRVLCWDWEEGAAALLRWMQRLPQRPDLLLWTKIDRVTGEVVGASESGGSMLAELPDEFGVRQIPAVAVSAQEGRGLDACRRKIEQLLVDRARQSDLADAWLSSQAVDDLEQIQQSLEQALEVAAWGGGQELVAAELRAAIDRLGRLVGTIYTDELLDSIFSRFCIGK